jgi:hypothetical protein
MEENVGAMFSEGSSGTDQSCTLSSGNRFEVVCPAVVSTVPVTEFDPRRIEGIALCRPRQRGARMVWLARDLSGFRSS